MSERDRFEVCGVEVCGVEVYGPAASSERARAVETALRAVGFGAELLAFREGPTSCVVLGDVAHIKSLIEPHGYLVVEDRAPYGLAPVPREELAARLDLLGRGDDAAKVRHGPPDEPQPRGASLLVVALADVVAVCWSHMRGEA